MQAICNNYIVEGSNLGYTEQEKQSFAGMSLNSRSLTVLLRAHLGLRLTQCISPYPANPKLAAALVSLALAGGRDPASEGLELQNLMFDANRLAYVVLSDFLLQTACLLACLLQTASAC